MSVIRESSNFTINNSVLNNIQGNAIIIRFGDGTLTGSEVEEFMRGVITLPDIRNKMEKRSLLQSITNLPRAEAAHNDYQSRKKNGLCLKGTRETLLGELASWILDTTKSRIYVLSGLAGIGKSTIAYTFASRADQLGILGASFFFSRDEFDRKSAKKLFTTMAFQLCVYDKTFAQAIGDALLNERGAAATTKDLNEQLEALILEPLRDIVKSRTQSTVILIDALDECDDRDGPAVLASLERLVRELPTFKVLLTTRPQPRLDRLLCSHNVFYLQNIEDKIVNNDIRLYLKYSLCHERVDECLPDLTEEWGANDEEIEFLVGAAGKLFIIASTTVLFVLDESVYNPISQMEVLKANGKFRSNDLECFYAMILRHAVPEKHSTKLAERLKTVIGAIIHVQEPLPIKVLQRFIPYTVLDIDAVLKNLKPVITVEDNIPRIYHKSFSDFLTDTFNENFDLHVVPENQHRALAIRCFKIMNDGLKKNILGLNGPSRFMNNGDGREQQGISTDLFREKITLELQYACTHWATHLDGTNLAKPEDEIAQELTIFANEHLLHWFEAMSWLGKLDLVFWALHIAITLMKPAAGDLLQLLSDGQRFMSRFYEIIEHSALHTYHSALPFTPTNTFLYKRYHKEVAYNICKVQDGPDEWDATIATPSHGEKIDLILFSRDSSMFASRSRNRLKLWDAITGAPIGAITGEGLALADGFSTAASLNGNTITLYDAKSCAAVATINVASAMIAKLAISPDGTRLAAGLSDGTVGMWNWKEGDLIAQFDGFAIDRTHAGAELLIFSAFGDRLVFGSDGGLKLRNGINGDSIAEWKYGDYGLPKDGGVVLSGNGSRLAYLADDWLALWNGENGMPIAISRVENVADVMSISIDGSIIATHDDEENSIKLWSEVKSNHLEVVDTILLNPWGSDVDLVSSLVFSQDDILAIGYAYSYVILYNTKNRSLISTLTSSYVVTIAFSPNSTRVVGGIVFSTMQLWDLQNIVASSPSPPSSYQRRSETRSNISAFLPFRLFQTAESSPSPVKGQWKRITALKFSPDCLRLASGYEDGTIRLWKTSRTQRPIATHNASSARINICAFSVSGSQLASGSDDGTIKLWDGRDGTLIGTIQCADRIYCMAFVSGMLATTGADGITLWDPKTLSSIGAMADSDTWLAPLIHHNRILACYKPCVSSEEVDILLWDVKERAPHATITFGSLSLVGTVEEVSLSPDSSKLVAQLNNGDLKVFDLVKKQALPDTGGESLGWLLPARKWHGVPVSLCRSDTKRTFYISARFSQDEAPTPVLWIPSDLSVIMTDRGSELAMFALGCASGHIPIIQESPFVEVPSPTSYSCCWPQRNEKATSIHEYLL